MCFRRDDFYIIFKYYFLYWHYKCDILKKMERKKRVSFIQKNSTFVQTRVEFEMMTKLSKCCVFGGLHIAFKNIYIAFLLNRKSQNCELFIENLEIECSFIKKIKNKDFPSGSEI